MSSDSQMERKKEGGLLDATPASSVEIMQYVKAHLRCSQTRIARLLGVSNSLTIPSPRGRPWPAESANLTSPRAGFKRPGTLAGSEALC